jgi:biotin/methionine sulfoxide reductase
VYEVEQAEGRQGGEITLPRLRPFSRDPDPSPIGLDQLDPSVTRLRIRRPAVRRSWLEHGPNSNNEGRGSEPFVEVDWATATSLVAQELARVIGQHGNTAIFGGSYGWSSAGRFHHAVGQLHRFLNLLGGYVRSVDSYSLGAGRALMPHVVTDMDDSNASHTSFSVLAEHTQLFVTFGGVPLKNTQVSSSGAGDHRVRAGLRQMAERGVRFVNISPVRDNLETGGPVEWIPIRPNTDTAVMLGLAHAIANDPRFDRCFVDRYTVGYDRFEAYLFGLQDGIAKTPAWAAEISGVPASRIASLARELLTNRSYGLGYGAMNVMGSAHRRIPGPVFPQGANQVKDFIPVARIADLLLSPGAPFTYQGVTRNYPDIRLVYWAGGNPFHHHQELARLDLAWRKPETIVVHEQYWTPAAKRADIVLPATTSLERDDIGFATREGFYIAMKRAVAPHAEARDDHAILAEIAEHLGVRSAFTEDLTVSQWLVRLYEENVTRVRALGIELPPFDAFWERGIVDLSGHDRPHIMHEDFRRDPEANRLRTPSGKIEIYSEKIAGFALADCPGYPVWLEPFEWLGHERAAQFPLHLLSDQPERRLHSQLDHSPHSRAGKVAGREPIYLNTLDAKQRGIESGDLVAVYNDRGRSLAGAIVTDDMMPGVVRLATGAWYDRPPRGGAGEDFDNNANPNSLTLDRGASSFSQGCSAQTCLVQVERFIGVPPAVTAYEPPDLIALT